MKSLFFILLLASSSTHAFFQDASEPVVLLFGGDLVLSNHVEPLIQEDASQFFENWNKIGPFDLFMVNLEHPITTAESKVKKQFNFKLHPRHTSVLTSAGISIVNAANNHVADYGAEGILQTMEHLSDAGIRYVGIGKTVVEARKPAIIETRGLTIAFLGYYGVGEARYEYDGAAVAPRKAKFILEDVRGLKGKVDFIVVNFHWGTELADRPEQSQIDLARRVIDAGADLIIGHHPHVLQGIEQYKGKTIAYSLGNFIFGGNSRHTYETAVLRVKLSPLGAVGEIVPVSVNQWRPEPAVGGAKAKVLAMVEERSKLIGVLSETYQGAHE